MSQLDFRGASSNAFVVEAGKQKTFPAGGTFIVCLESDGEFQISLNKADKIYFSKGIEYQIEETENPFQEFTFYNNTDADITAVIATGYGKLIDRRLNLVGGEIDVSPDERFTFQAGSGYLYVRDFAANAYMAGIREMMRGNANFGEHLSKGFVKTANASHLTATISTDIVDAVTNTGGILIHRVDLNCNGASSLFPELKIGGDVILRGSAINGSHGFLENYEVRSGDALSFSLGTNTVAHIIYEVL